MRNTVKYIAIPVLDLLAACGRGKEAAPAMDDALRNDLSLANSTQPYQPQQFVSPMEQAYMQQGYGQPQMMTAGTYYPAPAPVRRTTTTARPVYRSSGTTTARRAEPIRHTKRDAVIGAATGAVIGVATSRDKVKGGLIGAAIGGLAGAVVGHTIDVERP